ncbi:hypothetical protein, partial [Rhizobium sp. No.120]
GLRQPKPSIEFPNQRQHVRSIHTLYSEKRHSPQSHCRSADVGSLATLSLIQSTSAAFMGMLA